MTALLEVDCDGETKQFALKLSGGQVLVPITNEACRLKITFAEPPYS